MQQKYIKLIRSVKIMTLTLVTDNVINKLPDGKFLFELMFCVKEA